ncbi:hypothetical protein SARC_11384, partial [Sphaeroforma arctica JP610]
MNQQFADVNDMGPQKGDAIPEAPIPIRVQKPDDTITTKPFYTPIRPDLEHLSREYDKIKSKGDTLVDEVVYLRKEEGMLKQLYSRYHDLSYQVNTDFLLQCEVNTKLRNLLTDVVGELSPQQQEQFEAVTESALQVNPSEFHEQFTPQLMQVLSEGGGAAGPSVYVDAASPSLSSYAQHQPQLQQGQQQQLQPGLPSQQSDRIGSGGEKSGNRTNGQFVPQQQQQSRQSGNRRDPSGGVWDRSGGNMYPDGDRGGRPNKIKTGAFSPTMSRSGPMDRIPPNPGQRMEGSAPIPVAGRGMVPESSDNAGDFYPSHHPMYGQDGPGHGMGMVGPPVNIKPKHMQNIAVGGKGVSGPGSSSRHLKSPHVAANPGHPSSPTLSHKSRGDVGGGFMSREGSRSSRGPAGQQLQPADGIIPNGDYPKEQGVPYNGFSQGTNVGGNPASPQPQLLQPKSHHHSQRKSPGAKSMQQGNIGPPGTMSVKNGDAMPPEVYSRGGRPDTQHFPAQESLDPNQVPLNQYSCRRATDGSLNSFLFPRYKDIYTPGIPRGANLISTLKHKDLVTAITISNSSDRVYAGGKGSVTVWDVNNSQTPITELNCLSDNYIRSCKLLADDRTLIVGGETSDLCIWDLPTNQIVGRLESQISGRLEPHVLACYALALSPPQTTPNPLCYSCSSDGIVDVWDIHNRSLVGTLKGHTDGVSCVDITSDGTTLVTGGLDKMVKVWDLRTNKELETFRFPAHVFSIGVYGEAPFVAVGIENHEIEIFSLTGEPDLNFNLRLHQDSVLSLKFAHK